MLFIVAVVIGGWELYLRSSGFELSYDDAAPQWAEKRALVYGDKATVFIGSSRMKYDLDVATWEHTTGRTAVQLAIDGTSPMPVLLDLANDPAFKGRLVVDVTEILFFSEVPQYSKEPAGDVSFYKTESPAQKAGFYLNRLLESNLVLLDNQQLSLNAQFKKLNIPNRPGVFEVPPFPQQFTKVTADRQSFMTNEFSSDTVLQQKVQHVWAWFLELGSHAPPPPPETVPNVLKKVTDAVNKIRARGGDVVFTRTPSSGGFWEMEKVACPREKLWDVLLAATNCKGIHFMDQESTKHLVCPEWSHLSLAGARQFTQALITLLPSSFVKS
ncbi:hypothetical protein F0L74_05630 [Chitinophaga agrisoli]|uniref:GDSL-like lipase/acylhydrolase family protein n=1 Tax=Chitinophaga agrisoli TaxID=2607653 RepID=A0A5B2W409_9BACT|nr:hypothetical protein [Chitinophaga agrisoli]KAA2245440.1 hypothetical protein F0L74_05630 [Chitinophaga agrisoli]